MEDIACRKRHNSLESMRRSLVKAAVKIPLETVCAMAAERPERLKACVEVEAAILSDIIINKNLKLMQMNYFAQKVDVLFNFLSRSHCTCNRTYGKT